MTRNRKEEAMNHIVNPDDRAALPVLKDEERQPCEIWSRVMGYHRPVSSFNPGKQSEFAERRYYAEEPSDLA
jgi:hypothetical protein